MSEIEELEKKLADLKRQRENTVDILPYLWAYGDVFILEQLENLLNIPEVKALAESIFHLLLDHLLIDDLPKEGMPAESIERLRSFLVEARGGIPEVVELLNAGRDIIKEDIRTVYGRMLSSADGMLSGIIARLCEHE